VVFVRNGSPPSPSAKQSGYDKNKLRCCFIRNGSPPSPSTKQSGYDKNKVHRCDFNISEFKYSLGLYENILEMYLTHNI
jgi:hypothetical protein